VNPTLTRLAQLTRSHHTLTEIAEAAGVTLSFVSQVAAGRKKPSEKVKLAASQVLGLAVETIFPPGGDGHA
jgi:transcriptional regulator with XRE-family HTH domain